MAANNISYPHPVLGNGDDLSTGHISPDVHYEIRDEAIYLTVKNLLSSHPVIDQMVLNGDAAWHLRIQCSRTYMRLSFVVPGPEFSVRLKGEDYEGFVNVDISIVAQKDIGDYSPTGIHPDYGNEKFQIRAGEILGIGPTYRLFVDKVYDPLKAPVSSLVRVTEGDHKDGPFTITLDDDLIIVRLSKADWREYPGICERVPTVVHCAIVLPALAEAIQHMDKHTDTLWGGRLKTILEGNNIDPESPLAAAQQILASPVTRTFSEVNATLDRGES